MNTKISEINKFGVYHIENFLGIRNHPPSRGLRPIEMPLNSQKKIGYMRECPYAFSTQNGCITFL